MKRVFKYLAYLLIAVFVLLTVGMVAASYMFDKKIQDALSYVNKKQNHIQLKYVPVSSSILEKNGRLSVFVPKSKAGPVSAVFDVKTTFNFSSFDVKFVKVDNEGNLDAILADNGLPLIGITGAAAVSIFEMKAHGAVKTTAFNLPLIDGGCRVGENSVYLSARSTKKFNVGFASAGIKCKSDLIYSGREAYNLEFLNLKVKAQPVVVNKKVSLDSISVSFDSLKGQASTIYMIGFKPTDEVKDPTLADSFDIENFNVNLSLSDKDRHSRRTLYSDGSADIYFAFPFVKDGLEQKYNRIENINYKLSFGAFNLEKILSNLKDSPEDLGSLLKAVSNPMSFDLDRLSLKYQGGEFNVSGFVYPTLDPSTGKIKDISSKMNASGDIAVIDSIIEEQYKEALADSLHQGAITKTSKNYETTLEIKGKSVTLNGIALNADENADDTLDL